MAQQRLRVFSSLTAAVLALHACAGQSLSHRLAELHLKASLPDRMNVVYMQTVQISPPAPVRTQAPSPPPPQATPPPPAAPLSLNIAAVAPSLAASAAEPEPEPEPLLKAELDREFSPTDSEPAPTAALPLERAPEPEPAASAPSAVAATDDEAAPSNFIWPTSTLLRYRLSGYFRGELHGTAEVEWLRSKDRYQVFMEVRSGMLFARQMRSEGLITAKGLAPQLYHQETHTLFQAPRRVKMLFEPDGVTLANGRRTATLAGIQDTASQFVQLTYLFQTHPELLRSGHQISIPLALPSNVSRWVYEVMRPEVIDTALGAVEAFQLKPKRAQVRHNDLKAEIWIAPSLQYLPVRIRIALDDNTFVDLLISEAPRQGQVQQDDHAK